MILSNIEKALNELNLFYNLSSDHFSIIRIKGVMIDSIMVCTRDNLVELRTSGVKYSYHFNKVVTSIIHTRNEYGRFTHFAKKQKVHIRTVVSEQISQTEFIKIIQDMFGELDTVRKLLCYDIST